MTVKIWIEFLLLTCETDFDGFPRCANNGANYTGSMKLTCKILSPKLFLSTLLMCSSVHFATAAESTALDLISQANDYVGKDARDKVVQIRSDKSIGTLTPVIWYVVFYDPDATFKATEVKFSAGRKSDVKRPFRMLEFVKADKVFDRAKIKVDSDEAIKTATAEPLLKNLKLKATQVWLDRNMKIDLSVDAPIWKVRLWAAKLKNPNEDADIGDIYISADDGKVVKTDLHIDRVD